MSKAEDEGGRRADLERLLGGPATSWLVERVRARIPAAAGQPLTGVVALASPSAEQRAAVARLVGAPRRSSASLRVDLALVEEMLRRGPWPAGLADAVQALTGPVVDRRLLREQETAAWTAARDVLLPAVEGFDGLADWWVGWCAGGGLKRAVRAEATRRGVSLSAQVGAGLAGSLAAVLDELPADGEPLGVLARRVLGDAHALDTDRPLGRMAQATVAAAYGIEDGASARNVWAAGGVVLSSVSSTVVCLGVPGAAGVLAEPGRATATMLSAMRAARMPLVLTLDQVRSDGVAPLPAAGVVHVCENPSVVEVVADRWARSAAATAPVLVCTYGQPSLAVVDLVRALMRDGAPCRYHGDFDWGGLRIAQALARQVAWTPWRFRSADYLAAVAGGLPARELRGAPADAPWDPDLARAMTESGLVVEEEAVAELLADDLLGNSSPA